MTDSGPPPGTSPEGRPPAVPDWSPPANLPPPPPPPDPYAVDQTMRLIPIPHLAPEPAAPPAQPTQRHIGKYTVKGELGRGGMGAVYLAEQPGLGREVAIKELILSAVADPLAL